MFGAIQMRTKRHALIRHLAQFTEAENLEPARISEYRPRPRHKLMQPAHLADQFMPGTQIQMVGIRKQNLYAEVFQVPLRLALHRSGRAHRHERRRINRSVRSSQPAQARAGRLRRQHLELESFVLRLHPNECIRRKPRSNRHREARRQATRRRPCPAPYRTRFSLELPLGNLSPAELSPKRKTDPATSAAKPAIVENRPTAARRDLTPQYS